MGFKLTTLVVIVTDCTGNCKSNYHTITTTPQMFGRSTVNERLHDTTPLDLSVLPTNNNNKKDTSKFY